MSFDQFVVLYCKASAIVFAFGLFAYICDAQNIRKEMGMVMFLVCNFIASFAWIFTMPYTLYNTFKKVKSKPPLR